MHLGFDFVSSLDDVEDCGCWEANINDENYIAYNEEQYDYDRVEPSPNKVFGQYLEILTEKWSHNEEKFKKRDIISQMRQWDTFVRDGTAS